MPLPIQAPKNFRIIAHRGASAYAPENSAAAFKLAHEMGIEEVELDTQLTTDGQIALCHDTDLSRYGHPGIVVEEQDWQTLSSLDMGSWFSPYLFSDSRMWRLDDLFAAYGDRFVYHVEIKGTTPELAAAVKSSIDQYGLSQSCFITSFRYEALEAMRAINSDIRMGWLIREIDERALEGAQALNLYQLCPQAVHVTSEQVQAARAVVPEVRAWGVNGQPDEVIGLINRVIDTGCDGMTINWPDWVTG